MQVMDLAIATRRIVVEGTRHTISLIGKINKKHTDATFSLFVNGILHDKTTYNIQKLEFNRYFRNYKWMLSAKLEDDVEVTVEYRAGFFRRPEYRIYVGGQMVHQEKGTWGLI